MDKILPSTTALELAKQVLAIEADAIQGLAARLGGSFLDAVALLLNCKGRVVVSGIGKSGHIARKIASTMASTGTPAYFVHPAEASHGDIGMIARDDVLIALSNSGESGELLTIVPLLKRQGAKLIAITGNANSTLAHEADVHLDARVEKEACPLNLAPTASTTAALALGDALAVALLDAKGFGARGFRALASGRRARPAPAHPRVATSCAPATTCPRCPTRARFSEALLEMSKKRMGMTAVLDAAGAGCRRIHRRRPAPHAGAVDDIKSARIVDIMTRNPRTIGPDKLAVEAVQIMERTRSTSCWWSTADGRLVGALNMHDLFRAKVI